MTDKDLRQRLEFYRDLGIEELYVRPAATDAGEVESQAGAATTAEAGDPSAAASPAAALKVIQDDIGDCTRCRLHAGRTNIVFGSGKPEAALVFVGEGPGQDEDLQGQPFVGRAGQLLTKMIDGTCGRMGLPIRRPDVYICNVVKCRPPKNRAPERDEMEVCGQFLARQIEAIQPKAICVLGGTAAKALLNTPVGITKLRGHWKKWAGIPVMPTFHPSYLLRGYSTQARRDAFEDLKKVVSYVYL